MANRDVNIMITARDAASGEFRKVEASARSLRQALGAGGAGGGGDAGGPLAWLMQVGRFFAGASVITGGLHVLRAGLAASRGDSEKMWEAIDRLPFGLGRAARSARELTLELTGAAQKAQLTKDIQEGWKGVRSLQGMAVTSTRDLQDLSQQYRREIALAAADEPGRVELRARFAGEDRAERIGEITKRVTAEATRIFQDTLMRGISDRKLPGVSDESTLLAQRETLRKELEVERTRLRIASDPEDAAWPNQEYRLRQLEMAQRAIGSLESRIKPLQDIIDAAVSARDSVGKGVDEFSTRARQLSDTLTEVEKRQMPGTIKPVDAGIPGFRPIPGGGFTFDRTGAGVGGVGGGGVDAAQRETNTKLEALRKEIVGLHHVAERIATSPVLNVPVNQN